jgi:4-amino-4-deoxy-L-arabinose transferase-like glycosyltransferase
VNFLGFLAVFCPVSSVPGGLQLWVAVQILLIATATLLVFDTARRAVNLNAGLVAGISFALLYDTFRWTRTALSDIFFVFVLTLTLWALVRYQSHPTRKNKIFVYPTMLWLAFSRPFGPPIVASWLIFDLLPISENHRFNLLPLKKLRVAVLAGLGLAMVMTANI